MSDGQYKNSGNNNEGSTNDHTSSNSRQQTFVDTVPGMVGESIQEQMEETYATRIYPDDDGEIQFGDELE